MSIYVYLSWVDKGLSTDILSMSPRKATEATEDPPPKADEGSRFDTDENIFGFPPPIETGFSVGLRGEQFPLSRVRRNRRDTRRPAAAILRPRGPFPPSAFRDFPPNQHYAFATASPAGRFPKELAEQDGGRAPHFRPSVYGDFCQN